MSASSNIKIDGRRTYQRKYSMSPDRNPPASNEFEGTHEQFDDYEDEPTCQSKFQPGSPQLNKNIGFKAPEELESSAEEFLTTPEDLSTTKEFSATFNDYSTSFKDSSTTFKDISAEYEGTTKDPSTSKSYLTNVKGVTPICKGSYTIHKTTSETHKSTVTVHNLSAGKKKLPPLYTPQSNGQTEANSNVNWLIPLVLIISVAAVAYMVPKAFSDNQSLPSSKRNCSFEYLKSNFPNQDNILWKSLHVQIEGILNRDPASPSTFLFLYTNSKTQELVWKIAKTASACFDPSLEPMKLDKDDFTSQASIADYGVIIKKYKEQVAGGGALVVANLNEIPGKAARALHAICDTYNPIIDRVVIFMTLRVPNEVGKPIEVAENTLSEIWGPSLKRHELDPLITRVTEQVFYLSTETY